MNWASPNFDRGKTSFKFSKESREMIEDYMRQHGMKECSLKASVLYDKDGNFLTTIAELSRDNQPKFDDDTVTVSGEFPIDAYLKFYDILVPVAGIAYKDVPIERGTEKFVIEAQGNATILIKSEKAGINKLLTDVELKKAIQRIIDR